MVPVERLKAVQMLAELPDREIERLSSVMNELYHNDGDIIFDEGSPGETLYFIVSGEVVIRKALEPSRSAYRVISILVPGEILGEMALLESAPRSATAVAKGKVTLFTLERHTILHLILNDPGRAFMSAFFSLMTTLSMRLRQTSQQLVAIYDIVQLVTSGDSFRTKVQKTLDHIVMVLGNGLGGAIYIWSKNNEEYVRMAVNGLITAEWPISIAGRETFPRKLEGETLPKIFADPGPDFWLDPLKKTLWGKMRAIILAPLVGIKNPLAGFIVFIDPDKTNRFNSTHRHLLAVVAQLLSIPFELDANRDEDIAAARQARVKFNLPEFLSDELP